MNQSQPLKAAAPPAETLISTGYPCRMLGVGTRSMKVPIVPAQRVAVQVLPAVRIVAESTQLHPAGGVTTTGNPIQSRGTLNETFGLSRSAPVLAISS